MLNPQYTSKDFKDRWSKQGYEDSTKYRCYKKIPTLFCTKLWFCAMFLIGKFKRNLQRPSISPIVLTKLIFIPLKLKKFLYSINFSMTINIF